MTLCRNRMARMLHDFLKAFTLLIMCMLCFCIITCRRLGIAFNEQTILSVIAESEYDIQR